MALLACAGDYNLVIIVVVGDECLNKFLELCDIILSEVVVVSALPALKAASFVMLQDLCSNVKVRVLAQLVVLIFSEVVVSFVRAAKKPS